MGMVKAEPKVAARVEATKEEEMDDAEMAELEAALEQLKKREEMAKG